MTAHRAASSPRRPASRGVTLVELMIAITLGLLLVVVIAQLFLGSRQTFATTDDVSRMQDNIRYSQQLLTRTIHLAGYKSQANSATATVFAGNPPIDNAPPPAPPSAPAPGTDVLNIRYQGSGTRTSAANCQTTLPPSCNGADGTVVDCLGVRIDAGVIAVNRFYIAPSLAPGRPRPALWCNDAEIVPDVRSMQVLYGEDLNGDLVADRYVGPEVAPNYSNVVSVRVVMLFETPGETAKTAPDNQTYDMLDGAAPLGPYGDRRIRRVVATTINLRNRTP